MCLQYKKPTCEAPSNEAVVNTIRGQMEIDGIDDETGIDLNQRTYMAVTRRDVRTGAEVSYSEFLLKILFEMR